MQFAQGSRDELLGYALKYAGWGLRVLPLHTVREDRCTCRKEHCRSAGKHPRTQNGVKNATNDREQIQRWWEMWPDANVGIATGVFGKRGLYVIDVDCAKGASFDSLEDCNLADLICSRVVRTGSGGYHIYLQCSEPLPNTANKLGLFIDTRGEGGYVVAPPSRNAYGPYVWEAGLDHILPIPPELLAKLKSDDLRSSSYVLKKAEKSNEISSDPCLPAPQNIAHSSNCQSTIPTASVPQTSGPGGSSDLPNTLNSSQKSREVSKAPQAGPGSFSQEQKTSETRDVLIPSLTWRQQPDGVYQLSVGEHQICLVPHSFLPDLYTVLVRLAPDFRDERWFNKAPLAWARERVETRMRLLLEKQNSK